MIFFRPIYLKPTSQSYFDNFNKLAEIYIKEINLINNYLQIMLY